MQHNMPDITISKVGATVATLTALAASSLVLMGVAQAQTYPVTASQKAVATQVAQSGVPLSELASDAPDSYTIKTGDTLWAISRIFLKSPWRWPELWGMNYTDIRNPHLIFPGQRLYLHKSNGVATLTTLAPGSTEAAIPANTVRVSPRNRYETLGTSALPTLQPHLIEPFLSEPNIVGEDELQKAPRIVATQEGRVLLSRGDRAYVRGPADAPVTDTGVGPQPTFRVFRNPTPLKDPDSNAVLGYEAQYVGKALLVRGEATSEATASTPGQTTGWWARLRNALTFRGATPVLPTAAAVDIVEAKEEMRVGDRLLPEPERQIRNYAPAAPSVQVDGRIVSVYGSSVTNAAQNQVVVISKGLNDGLKTGDVLAILKNGPTLVDRTDAAKATVKLPNERNGLLMVFRPFDKLSYALILEITDGVKVGDRVTNPR